MIKVGDKQYLEISDYAVHIGKTIQTVYSRIKEKKVKTRKLMGKTVIEL
jgi:hypothetical protein